MNKTGKVTDLHYNELCKHLNLLKTELRELEANINETESQLRYLLASPKERYLRSIEQDPELNEIMKAIDFTAEKVTPAGEGTAEDMFTKFRVIKKKDQILRDKISTLQEVINQIETEALVNRSTTQVEELPVHKERREKTKVETEKDRKEENEETDPLYGLSASETTPRRSPRLCQMKESAATTDSKTPLRRSPRLAQKKESAASADSVTPLR